MKTHAAACGEAIRRQFAESEVPGLPVLLFKWRHTAP